MGASRLIKQIWHNAAGFTLVEAVVALGILSLAVGLVGNNVFQVLSIQRYWQDDRVASKDLRHAGSWLAGDAFNAETVTLGGTPADSSVTLSWTDSSGTPHTAVYSVTGGTLTRNLDGVVNTMATNVVSTNFTLDGKLLTFTMEVQADRGTTETTTLQTYLRDLK